MLALYIVFAALLVWFSFKSFRGGAAYLQYFREELSRPITGWTPMVTVIAPCKGVDQGMRENFEALLAQEYTEYEVVFVVDSADDPAVKVIGEFAYDSVKTVISPKAINTGQKVESLREGVMHADERSEIFVFVDSDARPSRGWLRSLVEPLSDTSIGATTGYRWFITDPLSFAGELRSAWNASIASALGPNEKSNFCWGGSMAITRETFQRLDIRERWKGTLSDDFAVTRIMREAGLGIRFVPAALIPSIETCTFRELLEFTTRQMKITRVYRPDLWLVSFFGSGVFVTVLAASALVLAISDSNLSMAVAAATLVLVFAFSIAKAWLRFRAVQLAIPEYHELLRRQWFGQLTLWLVAPVIFLGNCIAASFSTTVIWRGSKYKMVSPTETRRVDN